MEYDIWQRTGTMMTIDSQKSLEREFVSFDEGKEKEGWGG
jgi:hypothetical protein